MDAQQTTQANTSAQKEDLSSKTILILAVLVVIVSVVGALVNFEVIMSKGAAQQTDVHKSNAAVAQVGFNILPPPPGPQVEQTTAQAGFVKTK